MWCFICLPLLCLWGGFTFGENSMKPGVYQDIKLNSFSLEICWLWWDLLMLRLIIGRWCLEARFQVNLDLLLLRRDWVWLLIGLVRDIVLDRSSLRLCIEWVVDRNNLIFLKGRVLNSKNYPLFKKIDEVFN